MADKKVRRQLKVLNRVNKISLMQWNKWLALIFAVQAVVLLILSDSRPFPISVNFLGLDTLQSQAQGKSVVAAGSQTIGNVNLTVVVAIFLFVSAIAHGLLATKLRKRYESNVSNRVNSVRWIEYALSGGLMVIAASLLVGVQDLSTIIVLFGLTALMYIVWLGVELYNSKAAKPSTLGFAVGCAAGLLPWIVMAIYLISSAVYGSATPAYVYWAFGVTLVLFGYLGANMYLQSRKIKHWQNYTLAEKQYMFTSFVAKTVLAWIIFAGVLHP